MIHEQEHELKMVKTSFSFSVYSSFKTPESSNSASGSKFFED